MACIDQTISDSVSQGVPQAITHVSCHGNAIASFTNVYLFLLTTINNCLDLSTLASIRATKLNDTVNLLA